MVSPRAYLLFYRRRSDGPLGGPVIQDMVKSYKEPSAEGDSCGQSPSGEGHRLGGSSRTGSSSALAGAGAAHQAGDGGLRAGALATKDEPDSDDNLADSEAGRAGRLEGMHFTDDGDGSELDAETPQLDDSFSIFKKPSWSFGRVHEAHDLSQMTAPPPGSSSNDARDNDDLFDDNVSNVAVGDAEMDDLDSRLLELNDSPPTGQPGTSFEDVPPLLKEDSDDELPVVELRVGDDEKVVSD